MFLITTTVVNSAPDCGEFLQCFVVSANNAPTPPSTDGPFFGFDLLGGYRQRVLSEALAHGTFRLEDMAALQRDTRSTPWEELRDAVLAVEPDSPDAAHARDILAAWDGRMSTDSVGATVWALGPVFKPVRFERSIPGTGTDGHGHDSGE